MRKLYHVHTEYPRQGRTQERHNVARATWTAAYARGDWVEVPVPDSVFTRNSKTAVGDTRELPFVRDLVDFAADQISDPNDIIVLTNDDICFSESLCPQLDVAIRRGIPAFAYRWDFHVSFNEPATSLDEARWYSGSDLFVFSKAWWIENRSDFPDMIMACEYWDCILRQMIKRSGGVELFKAIYHEWHDSAWQQTGFRHENKGQLHNIAEADRWFARHGSDEFDTTRTSWLPETRQTSVANLCEYERYAKAYWSGISDSGTGAITPGPQWGHANEDLDKLLNGIVQDWMSPRSVMEFGCGEGRLAQGLASRFREYHGVDISPVCIERSKRLNIKNAKFELINGVGDVAELKDCIVSWTVFMHMPHWALRLTLDHLTRVLRGGGYLCFHLNNSNTTDAYRYDAIPDTNLWEGRWYPDDVAERMIKECGLEIVSSQNGVWIARKP